MQTKKNSFSRILKQCGGRHRWDGLEVLHWSLEAKDEIYKITQYFILHLEVKCGRRLGMRRLASPVNADEVFWIAQ